MAKTVKTTLPRERARRYRGRLFMALHLSRDRILGVSVSTDYASACLMLAGAHEGEIWEVPPNEGGPLRKYLAGEAPPLKCRMAKYPDTLVARIARTVGVSEPLARSAVADVIRDHGGIGAQLYFS